MFQAALLKKKHLFCYKKLLNLFSMLRLRILARFIAVLSLISLSICVVWWLTKRPSIDGSQLESLVVNNANYTILDAMIKPKLIETKLFLLVIVSSAPAGVSIDRRQAIRKTWATTDVSVDTRRWRVIFMTGRTGDERKDRILFTESKKYGDLLICDYKDAYSKITTKLLSSYQWATSVKELYEFEYVLKTDDDVYVSIPRLYQWIDTKGTTLQHVYAGTPYSNYVVRDKSHRHYVSKEDLPYDIYPTFCKGSMLLLSGSLIPKIVLIAKKVRRIVPDDAYVGLLLNELNVKAVHMKGLVQHSFLSYFLPFLGPCHFQNIIGMGDSLTTEQMFYIHSQISSKIKRKSSWLCMKRWLKLGCFIIFLFIAFFIFSKSRLQSICRVVGKLIKSIVPVENVSEKKSHRK